MNVNDYDNGGSSNIVNPEYKNAVPYFGRVVSIINMGLQHKSMWDNGSSKPLYWKPKEQQVKGANNQTYVDTGNPVTGVVFSVTVELPKLRVKTEEGEELGPMWVSKDFGPKSKELLAMLEGMGTYNLSDLINTPVSVTLGTTSGGKPKMAAISLAPEEVTVPELENDMTVFDFYDPDVEVFNKLPNFRQNNIKASLEFEGSKLQQLLNAGDSQAASQGFDPEDDSDIPF